MNNEKNKKEEQNTSKVVTFFKELIPYVLIIIVVLFVKNFIIAPVQVNGESMESTLLHGDVMILNRLKYKRHGAVRFDIVVISTKNSHIIKRVIGLPGDIIEMKDNVLYINGEEVDEYYLDKGTITEDFMVAVPEEHYFVMGDNRGNSNDSRNMSEVGFIDEDKIDGIAEFTIFPFNRIGSKK